MKGSFGSLRIIAGEFKGRKIRTIDSPGTRPMTDRVRESMFNIIQMQLAGSSFLDLYSGSGAVGIEAISRGASRADFVERSPEWCDVIRANIATCNLEPRTHLYCSDVFKAVPTVARFKKNYDIIFIGSPYDENLHNTTLLTVVEAGILSGQGTIIAQYRKGDELHLPPALEAQHRDYGITRLSFIRQNND